jgi:hypothetical protein
LWWVFRDRVSQTICLGWLRTTILLLAASWVARITQRCSASLRFFKAHQVKQVFFFNFIT